MPLSQCRTLSDNMGINKIARTTKFSGYADFEMRSKINENFANIFMIYHQFNN